MPTKEEIEEGYRILDIDSDEKRQKFKKIKKIVKNQCDPATTWEFKTVSNLEFEG